MLSHSLLTNSLYIKVVAVFFYKQGNWGLEGSSSSHIASSCQRGDANVGLSTWLELPVIHSIVLWSSLKSPVKGLLCKNNNRKWAKRIPYSEAEMSVGICSKGSQHHRTWVNVSLREDWLVAVILWEVSHVTALIRITPFIIAEVIHVLTLMCAFQEEIDSRQVKHTWRFWPEHYNWPDKKVSFRFHNSVVVVMLEALNSLFSFYSITLQTSTNS